MNVILIAILIVVSAWSLYNHNLYILIANICVISGVLIDEHTGKILMKEKANIKLIKLIKKLVPILYIIGAITLIIWGYRKYLN
jgi:hypothetical protein